MEKLTLEQVAPYLPYGLWVNINEDIDCKTYEDEEYDEIAGVIGSGNYFVSGLNYKENVFFTGDTIMLLDAYGIKTLSYCPVEQVKPLLRPMNLTKPIIVEDKEVIPIVELAKRFHTLSEATISHYDNIIDAGSYGIQVSCYLDKDRHGYYSVFADKDLVHHNESRVVKWLYANYFDVDGLIEKGLAIDATTLETNVYK
jgi:hypothetical protein